MNDLTKGKVQAELLEAIAKEKITAVAAGQHLNVNPAYLSMVKKQSEWGKFPLTVWEKLHAWMLSGHTIMGYADSLRLDKNHGVAESHGMVTKKDETLKKEPKDEPVKSSVEKEWKEILNKSGKEMMVPSEAKNQEMQKPGIKVKAEARMSTGQLMDLLINERDLLQQKIDAINLLLTHYIS
jgi:hypothetical protein